MSRGNGQQTFQVEDLLEIVIEIINNQPVPAVNPPTPSVNDFSQVDNDFLFTDQEIVQLKKAINNLETTEKEPITADKNDFVNNRAADQQLPEELKAEIKEELKQEMNEELQEEITFQIKEELKTRLSAAEKEALFSTESQENTFKKELIDYSLDYTPVKVSIQSGKEVKGVLCEVETDFIIVANQENQFIKVPLAKIVAVKEIDNLTPETKKERKKQVVKAEETDEVESSVPLPAPEKLLDRQLVKVENSSG